MASGIDKVIRLTEQLTRLSPLKAEDKQRLEKKFRLEFNYNSNHLEGNTLTYEETELLLIFDKTTGNHELREYEEMKAHDVALDLIKEWAADKERPVTESAIKNLHEILLVRPYWKDAITPDGQYTRRQIKIGNYKEYPNSVRLRNGEIFHYTSPKETPIKMGELITWFYLEEEKNEIHPVALAALFHYNFVRIHPFDDGNGRISRLLMNYVLLRHNLPPVIIKSSDKKNYLFALNQADTGNLDAFIEYIAEQLIWSLELNIMAANGQSIEDKDNLSKEIEVWKKQLQSAAAKIIHRDEIIIHDFYNEHLFSLFSIFSRQHAQFNDIFWKAQKVLLINKGIATSSLFSNYIINTATAIPLSINSISLQCLLIDYKYNEENSFTIESIIDIQFEKYSYIISYKDQILSTKKYSEYLSDEEMNSLVRTCIKNVFEEIKEKSR